MNREEKIEPYLRAAPKPPAPESLLNKLRNDIVLRAAETRPSALRRWFAPSGEGISRWRTAAAAVVAIIVLLPLSYGATKLIQSFIAIRQLPALKLDFTSGALSPDGRQFAGVTHDAKLVVINTSTGEQRNLAEGCQVQNPIIWSADGSEIAVGVGAKLTVLAVSLKTGQTRTLMERGFILNDWSPDGKFILGYRTPKRGDYSTFSTLLVDLETKEETLLAEDALISPVFSPKGDLVGYATQEAGRSIVHLQNIDGTSHAQSVEFPGEINQLIWSPGGSHLVFTGTQRGIERQYKDLWALPVQGNQFVGAPLPVVPNVEQMEFYNWSQNGQLAYRTGFGLGGIFTLPVDPHTGKASGAPRQVARADQWTSLLCWSPDGKQIALSREVGVIRFISASSGEKIRDLSVAGFEITGRQGMSWSPDGKFIAYTGSDKEKRGCVWLVTAETGDAKRVPLEEEGEVLGPAWSPDSKTIAYRHNNHIYVANLGDGKSRQLTSPTEPNKGKRSHFFISPVFAPDGRSVTYIEWNDIDRSQRILATTMDGKETRELLNWKNKGSSINSFDWSPDGRYLMFRPFPDGSKIWCVATDGGEPFLSADVSNLGEGVWVLGPEWSPKGDAINFQLVHEEHQYWVMENFLPAAKAGGR